MARFDVSQIQADHPLTGDELQADDVLSMQHHSDSKDFHVTGHAGGGAKDAGESQKRSSPAQQGGSGASQSGDAAESDDDIFLFGSGKGAGNVINSGENGWVDTIQLTDVTQGPSTELSGEGSWVLKVKATTTYTINQEEQNLIFEGASGSGLITLSDGSEVTFFNIERIEW